MSESQEIAQDWSPVLAEMIATHLRCLFAWLKVTPPEKISPKFKIERDDGRLTLGPVRSARLAELMRSVAALAGAPAPVLVLRADDLDAMLRMHQDRIARDGFSVSLDSTASGARRFTITRSE